MDLTATEILSRVLPSFSLSDYDISCYKVGTTQPSDLALTCLVTHNNVAMSHVTLIAIDGHVSLGFGEGYIYPLLT